ncbi:MAG: YjbQ family protein [Spirochaetales bacterium]|nr:YjbQ family protein [Spirochaetales bacterium]
MAVAHIRVRTGERCELRDITAEVGRAVEAAGVREGACTVFVPHTTAAVTVNENADPSVVRDMLKELEKIVPFQDGYEHAEGNSAAHLKASLVGPAVQLIVSGGRPLLGTWQGVYLCEFDGPRSRTVWVQVVGGGGP